jgi:hypothetical protein
MKKHYEKVRKLSEQLGVSYKKGKKLGLREMRRRLELNGREKRESVKKDATAHKENSSSANSGPADNNRAPDTSDSSSVVPSDTGLGKVDLVVSEAPPQPEASELKEQFFRASLGASDNDRTGGPDLQVAEPQPQEQYLIKSKLIDVKLPSALDEKKPLLTDTLGTGVVSFLDNRFRKAGAEPLDENEKKEIIEGGKEMLGGLGIYVHPIIGGTVRFMLGILVPPLKRGFFKRKAKTEDETGAKSENKNEPAHADTRIPNTKDEMAEAEKRYRDALKELGKA